MTRVRRADEAVWVRPEGVPDGSVVSVFRVPPEVAGQRLDVFLQGQLKRTSRTRTQFIIRASAYDDEGRRLRSNHRVRPFQQILLWRAPWDETPVPTDLPVLYEDEHLLAVNKPAHLPVHPSARYHKNTLIKVLQAKRPGEWLSLGHRLDRETSGVILLAKNPACDRALKRTFEERDGIEKTYLAITWGVPDPGDGARAFRFERSVELDPTHSTKVKMRLGASDDALYAATRFTVEDVRRTPAAASPVYARVRCELETGRQHQIRIHLAALGAPIVGDKLYGPDDTCFARGADGVLTDVDLVLLELPRHALHAWKLSLPHPVTGARLAIEAPFPGRHRDFWNGPPERVGRGRSHAARHLVEIDLIERRADERAAARFGQPARLQLVDQRVEPLEVLRVHRDADHLVVRRLYSRCSLAALRISAALGGRVEGARKDPLHLVAVEDPCRCSRSRSSVPRRHLVLHHLRCSPSVVLPLSPSLHAAPHAVSASLSTSIGSSAAAPPALACPFTIASTTRR